MNPLVKDAVEAPPPAARGRPRNLQLRHAVLDAARELLAQLGPSGVTMEAVAARAGVGKPTVYRWWPNRHAVTMDALMASSEQESQKKRKKAPAASASPLRALSLQLNMVVRTLSSHMGRNVTTIIAAADPDTELSKAFRNHFILSRRDEGRVLLQQAAEAGEIRADADLEIVLDQIYGPLFFRLLMGHAPLDEGFVEGLIGSLLAGLRTDPEKKRKAVAPTAAVRASRSKAA
ncbi:TetR family transcriptional regulator [Variovorax sp. KBW07]|uniref:TetR/AcrR family transcriptional regulator n=1 Tax=Variovorax sp. KBW07 TaxID=2153358 RepID=UPI000F55BD65|nr:TetR/AcrR family transcriptional regulator [Variovorax sp. KBW07]RQO59230.1 TetR family transcriptional regulator [Variovorax sp. KBW07]